MNEVQQKLVSPATVVECREFVARVTKLQKTEMDIYKFTPKKSFLIARGLIERQKTNYLPKEHGDRLLNKLVSDYVSNRNVKVLSVQEPNHQRKLLIPKSFRSQAQKFRIKRRSAKSQLTNDLSVQRNRLEIMRGALGLKEQILMKLKAQRQNSMKLIKDQG